MNQYQLKKNETFAIGVQDEDGDKTGDVVCITKSVNQIIGVATGIWAANALIWLEVWDYEKGEDMMVDEGMDIGEWELTK